MATEQEFEGSLGHRNIACLKLKTHTHTGARAHTQVSKNKELLPKYGNPFNWSQHWRCWSKMLNSLRAMWATLKLLKPNSKPLRHMRCLFYKAIFIAKTWDSVQLLVSTLNPLSFQHLFNQCGLCAYTPGTKGIRSATEDIRCSSYPGGQEERSWALPCPCYYPLAVIIARVPTVNPLLCAASGSALLTPTISELAYQCPIYRPRNGKPK